MSARQNYDLVFNQFKRQYELGTWNTSEISHLIRDYADSVGAADSAWVMPYPHWVDTRLVGIHAGQFPRDYALWNDQLDTTVADPRLKMFIFRTDDQDTLDILRTLYPRGSLHFYDSAVEGKNFYYYLVPPVGDSVPTTPGENTP